MLFKNVFKSFFQKKIQILAVSIIILTSSFIYVSMSSVMTTMESDIESYFKEYNQEDFNAEIVNSVYNKDNQIMTLSQLKSEDEEYFYKTIDKYIEKFKKEYKNTNIELRQSKDINLKLNNKSCTLRFLLDGNLINKTNIEEGSKPKNNNEIAISRCFAENNGLSIGSNIRINNKSYKIVGYVLYPDYTLGIFGDNFLFDGSKIAMANVSEEEFKNIKGNEEFRFSIDADKDYDFSKITNNENVNYISSLTKTSETMRSGLINTELSSGKASVISLTIMISAIAIIIVAIIVSKILHNQKGQIGILKAMGYKNSEIAKPYLILISIISFPMLMIGAILGMLCSRPLKNLYLNYFLLPNSKISVDFVTILFGVIIPFCFFVGLAYLIIYKMLNKKPLDLLSTSSNEKINLLTIIIDKLLRKAKTTTKFKYSFLVKNYGKFMVFLLGIFLSSMLVILGLMMPGYYDKISTSQYKNVDYNYEGIVDYSKGLPTLDNDDEKTISVPDIKYKNNTITIKGLESKNKLYKLKNKKNKNITHKLEEGVIVSEGFSMLNNKTIGDTIKVKINNEIYKFKIVEISEEYDTGTVYVKREKLSKIIGNSDDLYTSIYSKNKLDKKQYKYVISKSDIIEQTDSVKGLVNISLGIIIISAVIISVLILYVLTSLTVEDNYYNISLLKVMGYNKREVNSMILNSYLGYAIISYIISIPITVIIVDELKMYFNQAFHRVFPLNYSSWMGFIGLALIIGSFYLGSISSKRKIEKISLQEVLKEYRE